MVFEQAIVSANYRDRLSPFKWLVRLADAPPEAAVPCMSLKAEGVKFVKSDAREEGLGCHIVAQCDRVVAEGFEDDGFEGLYFELNAFKSMSANNPKVLGCEHLRLTESGKIRAKGLEV